MRDFRWVLWLSFLFGLTHVLAPLAVTAQEGPVLGVVAEFPLGDNCPKTGVLNADGTVLWTLMSNCVSGDDQMFLQGFSLADGSVVGQTADALPTNISPYDVLGFDRPLTLASDGLLNVDLVDTYTTLSSSSYSVDPATGARTDVSESPRILSAEQILAAIPDFTGYTDYLTYSDDRALALTQDDVTLFVFDVASGTEVMRLSPPGGVEYAGAWFGPGGKHLYVSQMVEPGNYENPELTLYVFDIPTGDLVSTTAVPHRIYAVSPDERYLVVSTPVYGGDNESLAVFEPATGLMSDSLPTRSSPVSLSICKNDGRSAPLPWSSDDPVLTEILWLPDSSGFVTLQTEVFSSGPNPCYSNDSRMRVYAVTG